jgi:Zn-dependent protease with chaperone function
MYFSLQFFQQLSDLHQLLQQAAKILNTEVPDLYVRQNPVPNAYTLAISGKKPFIVVHTSLVELLSRKELQVPFNIHFFPTGLAIRPIQVTGVERPM